MREHPSRRTVALAVALTLALVGCASSGGTSRPEGATTNRIVKAELEPLGQLSPLQAIERLRPRWLRSRSGTPPVLHVDGTRRGDLRDINAYRISDIERIEYMSASDATTRFGTGYDGGVIMVTTGG